MTIRLRILALLALLSLFCIGTTEYFTRLHEQEEVLAREQQLKNMTSRLQRLSSAVARPAGRYLDDYSGRGGLVEFLVNRDPVWAEKNIRDQLDLYRIDGVWVLAANGAVLYGLDRLTEAALAAPPLALEALRPVLQTAAPFAFHAFIGGKLHHLQGRPITAGLAPEAPAVPLGWLIVAQQWGEPVLQDLADAAQGYIALTGASHVSDVRTETEREVWQPLKDHRGRVIAGLDYHVSDPVVEDPAMEKIERSLFIVNGVGAVLLVGVLLHFWFLRPFVVLRASLLERDPALLGPLLDQRNEFGQMAGIIQSSMRDREQLRQSLEERVRLGRELHDGAIQSVYGTGMALGRVQSLLARDLPAAHQLLEETKAELNRVLLDLRRHLEKVDPKPLDISFAKAVARLVDQLHGPTPVATELQIDEELVASHPVLHRTQALQFVREAVSNALRHGRPTKLAVTWQRSAGGSQLTIADDGVGFDPKTIAPGGRGLGNLSERAVALGGRLEIDSSAHHGSRISLHLPAPPLSP